MWLATPWHIGWESYQVTSLESYLDWLDNPKGNLPIDPDDGNDFFLFAVLVLETLWNFQNRVLFEGKRTLLEAEVKSLYGRFEEFLSALNDIKKPYQAPP